MAKNAVVVQLVGFGKPEEHLACYLKAMRAAGFEEYDFESEGHQPDQDVFWRSVPHRKWYTWLRPEAKQASAEGAVLIHRASLGQRAVTSMRRRSVFPTRLTSSCNSVSVASRASSPGNGLSDFCLFSQYIWYKWKATCAM